jgi:predicted AAA+ superfamily ATPase
MSINQLKQLLLDQKKVFLQKKNLIEREIEEKRSDLIKSQQIIVVSGVRRSGKSSFLKLIAEQLLKESGVREEQIFYVNFDDEFFVDFKKENFNDLLAAYYELGGSSKKKIYCFFDEIQNVKYWEKWVNKLNESSNFKIFITGSNSSLLSSEIATSLTGRSYTLEIFPFSFSEFLVYKKQNIPNNLNSLTTEEKSILKKKLDQYLKVGGFPESLVSGLDILEENYKNIIYKDIIARFKIKHIAEFRSLSLYLMSNLCSLMSYRSLEKVSSGLDSSMTIKNYINYMEDAYIFFSVKKLDSSVKKQLIAPFKIYSIDNAMARSVAFTITQNKNKFYENLVFLHLRRQRGNSIYYFKGDFETDFVVMKKNRVISVVQVCCDLQDENTKNREKRALLESLNILKQKQGYIINDYLDQEEIVDSKKILYLPLYKFLLLK